MQNRTIIENVRPEIDGGRFFIKRVPGERVEISADIFGDGHDAIRAALLYKHEADKDWSELPMQPLPNDVWTAEFRVEKQGFYHYKLTAWVDHLLNWYQGFRKKRDAGQAMGVELRIGARLLREAAVQYAGQRAERLQHFADVLSDEHAYDHAVDTAMGAEFRDLVESSPLKQFVTEYDHNLRVRVGRPKELFSTWYEVFPRSTSPEPHRPGTLRDVIDLLPRVADLGFDVLYFPPIHPVGKVNRKGKNNSVNALVGEPGSPWAIGSDEGGHKTIAPELGTLDDYKELIRRAADYGIEIAMDVAFQCAPDHPYIKEHPDWFLWRPDGTIAYAENPPKKYQDIVPLNFETDDWKALWEELKSVFIYWCEVGIRIFRIDNPHTKPFRFWQWVIGEVQAQYPDSIFLSEAFTRPKVMAQLAKGGFTQSYTYFTWRTSPQEIQQYMTELTKSESREYFRPNFWPNTPDILPYELMGAGHPAFIKRVVLAATLSSNYGMYAPAYELMENAGADTGKDEYHNSEKYETRHYDWNFRSRVTQATDRLNQARKAHPALQTTWNIHFSQTDNPSLLSYIKWNDERTNFIWVIVNFDPHHTQSGHIEVPKSVLGINGPVRLRVIDQLTDEVYHWYDDWNFVMIDPFKMPAHLLLVEKI